MRISEIALPRFKSKDERSQKKEVTLWFSHYFRAREAAKEIFNIQADPIQMPYSQPETVSWNNDFYPRPYLDKLEPLLKILGVVPTLLEKDQAVIDIADLAKKLVDSLEVYRNIRIVSSSDFKLREAFFGSGKKKPPPPPEYPRPEVTAWLDDMITDRTRNLDPDQEKLNALLLKSREEPKIMPGIRPEIKFPQEIKPEWEEVKDWREVKRDYHNQISLDLKNFVYPKNLIKLISKSGMAIKI